MSSRARRSTPATRATCESLVADNLSAGNGQAGDYAGIFAEGVYCRVDGKQVVANDYGIDVEGSKNVIVRNGCGRNAVGNYTIAAGNQVGPIGAADTATSPWANFSNETSRVRRQSHDET